MSEKSSDFGDNELRKCAEETNDGDFVPPIWKTKKRTRKLRPGARRIQHKWKHEEVVALIAAVEKRRGLWDVGSDEYRFKVNLANYHKKKSEQGADEPYSVSWRYFQQMLFLHTTDASQKTGRRPTKKASSAVADRSAWKKDFVLPAEPTAHPVAVDNRRRQQNVTATPTPPISPDPPTNLSCPNLSVPKAVAETPDRNAAFCNYLLAELSALSEGRALDLRRAFNQTLWHFLDSSRDDTVKQLIGNVQPPVLGNIDANADAFDVKINIFE